eukprot:scaffold536_cov250-Pinguiococcus_pyrenoidosus.AAC.30
MDARAAETQDEWALLAQCVGQFQEISAQLRDEKHKVVFKQQREEARVRSFPCKECAQQGPRSADRASSPQEKRRRERQTRGNPSLEADLQSLISSNPDKEDQIRALQRLGTCLWSHELGGAASYGFLPYWLSIVAFPPEIPIAEISTILREEVGDQARGTDELGLAWPSLACLALPCIALPCPGLPCLALVCLGLAWVGLALRSLAARRRQPRSHIPNPSALGRPQRNAAVVANVAMQEGQ